METLRALGKYELRGTLGSGAMGTVLEGWDPNIARKVAIKTVNLPAHPDAQTKEAIARFRREAQAAGRLSHPNIVAVHDYGETADVAYIVMEYVDGPTLKSLLDKQKRFTLSEIHRIMEGLLAGLQYSHDCGVVHRDIKPANVMLNSEQRCKIADFGIARIENSDMTQEGTLLGTPAYKSPEQFRGEPVDHRTDIYSSGVMLFQLLTGERPFEGSFTSIMHKVLNLEPPAPSRLTARIPTVLDDVVNRAMAKRPEERYPSAAVFATALATAIEASASRRPEAEATVIAPWVRAEAAPAATPAAVRTVSEPQTLGSGGRTAAPRRRGLPIGMILGGVAVMALAGGGAAWLLLPRGPHGHRSGVVAAGPPAPPPRSTPRSEPISTPVPVAVPAPAPVPASVPAPAPVPANVPAPASPPPSEPIFAPQNASPVPSEKPPRPPPGTIAGGGGSPSVQGPGAVETALHLSTAQRQAVQASLQALGYNTGGQDGNFGPMTRAAIAAYQVRHGMTPNGFLTEKIVKSLLRGRPAPLRPVASLARRVRAIVRARVGLPVTHAVACQLPPDGHTEMLSPAVCRQRGGLLD